jgi:hypothetical protein
MRWQTSLALLSVLLSGCDPVETIYVERPNGQPLLCQNGEKTEYEVVFAVTKSNNRQEILYEERHRLTVDPRGGALSTNPDRVSAGILAGSFESGRVPWIQFYVYCGDSEDPFLVTPRITRKDLKRVGKAAYLYVVE